MFKKLLILTMLCIFSIGFSQRKNYSIMTSPSYSNPFTTDVRFTSSVYYTPVENINIGADIEIQTRVLYIRPFVTFISDVKPVSYMDYGASFGLNKHFDDDKFRLYGGIHAGIIRRDWVNPNAYYGFEGGFDYYPTNTPVFFGIRGTYDYRTDLIYWGGEKEYEFRPFIRVGIKF